MGHLEKVTNLSEKITKYSIIFSFSDYELTWIDTGYPVDFIDENNKGFFDYSELSNNIRMNTDVNEFSPIKQFLPSFGDDEEEYKTDTISLIMLGIEDSNDTETIYDINEFIVQTQDEPTEELVLSIKKEIEDFCQIDNFEIQIISQSKEIIEDTVLFMISDEVVNG